MALQSVRLMRASCSEKARAREEGLCMVLSREIWRWSEQFLDRHVQPRGKLLAYVQRRNPSVRLDHRDFRLPDPNISSEGCLTQSFAFACCPKS